MLARRLHDQIGSDCFPANNNENSRRVLVKLQPVARRLLFRVQLAKSGSPRQTVSYSRLTGSMHQFQAKLLAAVHLRLLPAARLDGLANKSTISIGIRWPDRNEMIGRRRIRCSRLRQCHHCWQASQSKRNATGLETIPVRFCFVAAAAATDITLIRRDDELERTSSS